MAPSDPSDTVLAVCLRVRQSGALRVFVALGRIILDLWAAPPQCGYWGSMGSFCSAPQDFGLLGFFCARFPPREASIIFRKMLIRKPKQIFRKTRRSRKFWVVHIHIDSEGFGSTHILTFSDGF